MRFSTLITVLATSTYNTLCLAAYTLIDDLSHAKFFEMFDLFSDRDPTSGFVVYQPLDSAIENKYIGYLNESIYLGVDFENKTPAGRPSIRAESKKSWNHGLLIADIRHMPASTCGTWPAFWTLGSGTWPQHGEIDILEGVNDQVSNAVTLHTTAGCVVDNITTYGFTGMTDQASFTGSMMTDNCDVAAADQDKNQGCSIHAPTHSGSELLPTYGTDFNAAGGGVYAMEWTKTSISVWFFPRNSSAFTKYFANTQDPKAASPDPSTWGMPMAKFAGQGCDVEERFKELRVIFDVTFCGEWAGRQEVWDSSCAAKTGVATCEDYVRDVPEAFVETYWEIEGLWWFEDNEAKRTRSVNPRMKNREYKW